MKKTILSGMRPTGKLHLGHWMGALSNWTALQQKYRCFFMAADWHAVMSEYKDPSKIRELAYDNVSDWLAFGVDPEVSVVFIQSQVPEHLELFMILSCLAPLGWLSRCPTFKEQIKQLKDKEVNTYAFLGYPVLQTSDIVLYGAHCVPVGDDQLPHLELSRKIVRRFNHIYKKDVLIEPQALLTQSPRLPGLDGRKMSKSYNNFICLDEDDESLRKKVLSMITDPQRIRKSDKGHPEICNVYSYYSSFYPELKDDVYKWCTNADRGCKECKAILADKLTVFIGPRREEKHRILNKKGFIEDALREGSKKAQSVARETLSRVKEAMGI
ncbi:MAG: tryptophan--tRNA ligase [Candidatus Omnitrophota bacterium]